MLSHHCSSATNAGARGSRGEGKKIAQRRKIKEGMWGKGSGEERKAKERREMINDRRREDGQGG